MRFDDKSETKKQDLHPSVADIQHLFTYDNVVHSNTKPITFSDNNKPYRAMSYHHPSGPYFELTIRPHSELKISRRPNPRAQFAMSRLPANQMTKQDNETLSALSQLKSNIHQKRQALASETSQEAGWKFHLSIEQSEENKEKAWNALMPLLLQYHVGEAKITQPGAHTDENKVITIYTFKGGPAQDQWADFVQDVEKAFGQGGIMPGEPVKESNITGSDFFYYRNDKGHNGEYVKNGDNITGEPDPFKDIDLTHDNRTGLNRT